MIDNLKFYPIKNMEHTCKFVIQRGYKRGSYCDVIINRANTAVDLCPFHQSVQERLDAKKQTRTWAVAVTPTQEDSKHKYYKFPKNNYEEVEYFEENNDEWIVYPETSDDEEDDMITSPKPSTVPMSKPVIKVLIYRPDPASSLYGIAGLYQIQDTNYIIKHENGKTDVVGKLNGIDVSDLNETEEAEVISMGFSMPPKKNQ